MKRGPAVLRPGDLRGNAEGAVEVLDLRFGSCGLAERSAQRIPKDRATNFDAIAEDPLYEVLDKLHPHRAAIEAALVERERSLVNLDITRRAIP